MAIDKKRFAWLQFWKRPKSASDAKHPDPLIQAVKDKDRTDWHKSHSGGLGRDMAKEANRLQAECCFERPSREGNCESRRLSARFMSNGNVRLTSNYFDTNATIVDETDAADFVEWLAKMYSWNDQEKTPDV